MNSGQSAGEDGNTESERAQKDFLARIAEKTKKGFIGQEEMARELARLQDELDLTR